MPYLLETPLSFDKSRVLEDLIKKAIHDDACDKTILNEILQDVTEARPKPVENKNPQTAKTNVVSMHEYKTLSQTENDFQALWFLLNREINVQKNQPWDKSESQQMFSEAFQTPPSRKYLDALVNTRAMIENALGWQIEDEDNPQMNGA